MLAGCAPEQAPETPQATASPKPTPSAERPPDPAPDEEAWERFADPRTPGSFEIPPGWTVSESEYSEPEYELYRFELRDVEGETQLTYARKVMGLGGGCGDDPESYLTVTELDATPVAIPGYVPNAESRPNAIAPQFSYRAIESALEPGVFATLALSDTGPGEYCFYYNVLTTDSALVLFADTLQASTSDAVRHFDTMEAARAYMETEEYTTLKRVLLSFRLDG